MANYRNPELLALASKAPHCMAPHCRALNVGQVVSAHSNQSRDGKGMGIKAHDFRVAYVCDACHREIDQGAADRADKISMWEEAHRATIGWLFSSGHLTLAAEPIDMSRKPEKTNMSKPTRKVPKGRPLPKGRKLPGGGKIENRGFEKGHRPLRPR